MSVNKSKIAKSIQDRGQYFTAPNEIWTLPLSIKAKTTYLYLMAQSDKWNPGLRTIAEALSISVNTVRAAIKELEAAKMIIVDESPNGLRNVYVFTAISDWDFQAVSTFDTATVSDEIQDRVNGCTGGVSGETRIQEEYNTNQTIQSKTREVSEVSEVSEVKIPFLKDEESNTLPPWKVKTSPWYQHYLKSSIVEQKFHLLPESIKQQAFYISDKDEFLTFVNQNTPVGFKYVDPLTVLVAMMSTEKV